LTAEAISEFLERPLYSVGLGELGSSASQLEENLKDLLDVAHVSLLFDLNKSFYFVDV
jgi:hypothetical protein